MKLACLFTFLLLSFLGNCQHHVQLNPEERAYLFHIVKKSPILNNNIGRYFDYKGPKITFPNGVINYDSVELLIMNQPDILLIRHQEIAKSTKGVIAEAANKMAIWELNKMLLAKRTKKNFDKYEGRYAIFEKMLVSKLPPTCLKEGIPVKRMHNVLNPSMAFEDKKAQLRSLRGMTRNDEMVAIQAINYAINAYVKKRTIETYRALGGKATDFENYLTAVGDGSATSGLLDEREKDEKGRWNKGLPKAIGLFPYQVHLEKPKKKRGKPEVEPYPYSILDFTTVGKNRATTLHFDVWGYNTKKQTTVVIEKDGKSYHLFGSGETRFLSPDSTFSDGKTFQSIINELEFDKIGGITEKIEGKKGYDYWIGHYNEKKDETELEIEKSEKGYIGMTSQTITTKKKPSRKAKRKKRKARKSGAGADAVDVMPTTDSNKKKRGKKQNDIVSLYDKFQWYGKKIKELEKEKQEAVDLRARYQLKLDHYKRLMGYNWVEFEEENGVYLFQDSAKFDLLTQEFIFPPSMEEKIFEVKLIGIPASALSNNVDEVMMHVSKIDAKPNYNARLQVQLQDQFESDTYQLKEQLIQQEDSVAILEFMEALLEKEKDFSIVARGQGIGKWNGAQVVRDNHSEELKTYPDNQRNDSVFKQLRLSELFIHIHQDIVLEVNSFTDPVVSRLEIPNSKMEKAILKYGMTRNDVLSAYRTAAILQKFKEEINFLAGTYLSREKAKDVIDRFNSTLKKVKVSVGPTSYKLDEFENY